MLPTLFLYIEKIKEKEEEKRNLKDFSLLTIGIFLHAETPGQLSLVVVLQGSITNTVELVMHEQVLLLVEKWLKRLCCRIVWSQTFSYINITKHLI